MSRTAARRLPGRASVPVQQEDGGGWLGTAPSTATKQHRALLRTVACMCRRYVRWAAASHTRCADTTRASKVGHCRWRLQRRHPCSRQQAVQHNGQASQSIDLQGMGCVGWRSALVIQQVCVCVSHSCWPKGHTSTRHQRWPLHSLPGRITGQYPPGAALPPRTQPGAAAPVSCSHISLAKWLQLSCRRW